MREGFKTLLWRNFCKSVIKVFYRNFEVAGFEKIPRNKGTIFCANHVNALVDPLIVQAGSSKLMRPLARSGLFSKKILTPILSIVGAIPIYRADDANSDTSRNDDSFSRVYELLEENQWIMIFPEGQSHSNSKITRLKTGAARMILGTIKRGQATPQLIPVGLTFSKKGTFRGDVLVYFGSPVDLSLNVDIESQKAVEIITDRLTTSLEAVTINADTWEDIELLSRVDRFFTLRDGKYRKRRLIKRFKTLKRLISRHQQLRKSEPNLVERVSEHLNQFEQYLKSMGIKDYHLNINYKPAVVFLYSLRMIFMILVIIPIALWALINSGLPFYLTRHISRKLSKGTDQYDTTKIIIGFFLFLIFWTLQSYLIFKLTNLNIMFGYIISLILSAAITLKMRKEIFSIKENVRVFFLVLRRRGLKEHLINKRKEIEKELATLVKTANRLAKSDRSTDDKLS